MPLIAENWESQTGVESGGQDGDTEHSLHAAQQIREKGVCPGEFCFDNEGFTKSFGFINN